MLRTRHLQMIGLVIGSLSLALASAAVAQQQSTGEFLARWKDEKIVRLMSGALYTASHYNYADEKRAREVLDPVYRYFEAIDRGDPSALEPQAIKAFKDQLAGLLTEKDQVLRAVGAALLGLCGDRSYTKQVAVLLKPRRITGDDPYIDRGWAAMALGMLGAKEYTAEFVALLKSPHVFDRSGAAVGLGALGATEHREAIAKLLNDPENSVRDFAKEALALMDEKSRR